MLFEEGYISIPECYRTYRKIAQRSAPIWPAPDGPGPAAGSGVSGADRSPKNQALLDDWRKGTRLRLSAARRACLKELSRLIKHVRITRLPGSSLAIEPRMLQAHPHYLASPACFDLETGRVGEWRREPFPLEVLETYDAENPAYDRLVAPAPIHLLRNGLEPVEGLDEQRGCFLAMKEDPWVHVGTNKSEAGRTARLREHEGNLSGFLHDWRTADPEQTARHILDLFGRDVLVHHINGVDRGYLNRFVVENLMRHGRKKVTTDYAKAVRDELVKLVPEITRRGPRS